MNLFSQRESKPSARYSYSLPEKFRSRFLHILQQHKKGWMSGGNYSFHALVNEVSDQILAQNGALHGSHAEVARMGYDPLLAHFVFCPDEMALDFIEMCFRTHTVGTGDDAVHLVEVVNRIFEEEGIGYELTPPKMIDTGKPASLFGRQTGTNFVRFEHPQIVKKGDRTVHDLAVKPALEALGDTRFSVANSELLKAFEEVRKGDYADAITSCGSAFESVLRTICHLKGWAFDPQKDTCSALVGICNAHGLFPPVYVEVFKNVGMVRNKMGDAHGKGPTPPYVADRNHAEHMIAMTCAHIDFLVRIAGF